MNQKLAIPILCTGIMSPVTWAGNQFPKKMVNTAPSLARFILTFSNLIFGLATIKGGNHAY
jgi:hypothetical protein